MVSSGVFNASHFEEKESKMGRRKARFYARISISLSNSQSRIRIAGISFTRIGIHVYGEHADALNHPLRSAIFTFHWIRADIHISSVTARPIVIPKGWPVLRA
jgi:hypothetical protein